LRPGSGKEVCIIGNPLTTLESFCCLFPGKKANEGMAKTAKVAIRTPNAVFKGKKQVRMFEMTKLVSGHVKK
jgi:hypothetical protein